MSRYSDLRIKFCIMVGFNYGFIRRICITERIKLPTFIYLLFRLFTTQAFNTKKRLHIRISVYFDYFIRVLYERRYTSHMVAPSPLHRHLTVAG